MMKNILIIKALLFVSININSQNIEQIRNQNTFFILLNHKDKLSSTWCTDKLPFNVKLCVYSFYNENEEVFKYSFNYSDYPDADKKRNDMDKCMLFWLDKSFLRKNKDIIITRKFMEKVGLDTMLSLLYDDGSNKTIFLINTADTKNGKILVREVSIDYTAEE